MMMMIMNMNHDKDDDDDDDDDDDAMLWWWGCVCHEHIMLCEELSSIQHINSHIYVMATYRSRKVKQATTSWSVEARKVIS